MGRSIADPPVPPAQPAGMTGTTAPASRVLLVNVQEMADALGISLRQAYKFLDTGEVECRYIGKRRLVVWESLRDFVRTLPTERRG